MHRVVAWISQRLFDNVTYTVNHGILKGMRRRGGLGWVPQWIAASAETKEHEFFRSLDLKGKVVFDVGAFIGLFTMLASAKQAARVICYEPMDRNRRRLLENLKLNRATVAGIKSSPSAGFFGRIKFDPAIFDVDALARGGK